MRLGAKVITLSVVAGLLAAAAIALALVSRSEQADRDDLAHARAAAVAAAGQLVINLDALSAPTVDRDMALVAAGATGRFREQFTGSQAQLKKFVVDGKISSQGKLVSEAVVRADTDTATVLVAVDRTFKDASHPDGVIAKDRWKVSLEKHHGRWLVADLEPVA